MSPEAAREWIKILRDVATVSLAAFILIHETIASRDPNWELIGAGLTLLGLPPALRIDELRRQRNGKDDEG